MRKIKRSANYSLATATFIQLLKDYVNDEVNDSSISQQFNTFLKKIDSSKSTTKKLLSNFDSIPKQPKRQAFYNLEKFNLTKGTDRDIQNRLRIPMTLSMSLDDDVSLEPAPTFPNKTEFRIEYTGLYCKTEQKDWGVRWGATEPYIIVSAVHIDSAGENIVRTTRHPVGSQGDHYEGVDSGEFKSGPIAACWQGNLKGVSLLTTVMEHDSGNIDEIEKGIDLLVKGISFILSYIGYPIPENAQKWLNDLLNWLTPTGDDLIGEATYHISEEWMRRFAGYSDDPLYSGTNIPYHFSTEHTEGGNYSVLYRIKANKEPVERGIGRSLVIPNLFHKKEEGFDILKTTI